MRESLLAESRAKCIKENLKRIREEVLSAALASGRSPDAVEIMAVTKTVDAPAINHAITCGIHLIGENRVQEYIAKKDGIRADGCRVHMIGHLQTNKVRQAVEHFSAIQSVDTVRLAREIGKRAAEAGKVIPILLEVNIGGESAKFGFDCRNTTDAVYEIAEIHNLKIMGLMTVPPILDDADDNSTFFSNMQRLFIDIRDKKIDNVTMNTLSMGMSADYKQAIAFGSTLVRLGSAIFGERTY